MISYIRQAFRLACGVCNSIHNAYDTVGCFAFRALMDKDFLAPPKAIASSAIASGAYGWAVDKSRDYATNTLTLRAAGGDFGPKPSMKPALMNLSQVGLPYLSKMNWNSPVMMGAAFISAGIAAYAMTHTGNHAVVPDIVGTIYSSTPQTGPRASKD